MNILKVAFLTICLTSCAVFGQVTVSSGTIKRLEQFSSKYVTARNVDVWLPDGYSTKKKYAVLYMHDGQMLFDAATTWNKQEWQADENVTKLLREKRIREVIVVGIWNNGEYRSSEYFPEKALRYLPAETRVAIVNEQLKGKPRADDYLKFMTGELKPYIDKNFSTLKDQKNTFIMGSSMGALISIYALCEFPNVFGGAAGISTHLPLNRVDTTDMDTTAAAFRTYLEKTLPKADTRKIYFDHGDQTLDAYYPPLQKKVDEIMIRRGYTAKGWETRSFPGENHSETSWAKRLSIPLEFLLGR